MSLGYSTLLWLLAGVSLYASLAHFVMGLPRPHNTLHIKSATLSLCAGAAMATAATMATTHSLPVYLMGVRVSTVLIMLMYVGLILFIKEYADDRQRWLAALVASPYVLLMLVGPLLPHTLFATTQPELTFVQLPWGETITKVTNSYSRWMKLIWVGHWGFIGYIVWNCVRLFRQGPVTRAWGLALSGVPFAVALFLSFNFAHPVWHLPAFVSSFGLLPMIILMSVTISGEGRRAYLRMQVVVNNVPAVVYVKRFDGRYMFVNRYFETMYGLSSTQVLGKTDSELFDADRVAREAELDREVIAGRTVQSEEIFGAGDARHTYAALRFPVADTNGTHYATCCIATDITERQQAAEALRQFATTLERRVALRTDDLGRLNSELEAFCYSVSHDLRAPLMAVNGFADLLLRDYTTTLDQNGQKFLHRIRDGAKKMGVLIDDLLALSRVTREELRREPCNLSELAHDVVRQLREEEPSRHLVVQIDADLPVNADKRLLSVVMNNLLSNAWKYTSKTAAACIQLGVKIEGGQAIYFVRDNGAGFDPKLTERLFQPFKRLHSEREFPGTGVGLATVARIIHRHGGRIWAEGTPQLGAVFFFTLPVPEQDASLPQRAIATGAIAIRSTRD